MQVQVSDEKFPFCIFLTQQTLQCKVPKPAFFPNGQQGANPLVSHQNYLTAHLVYKHIPDGFMVSVCSSSY